MSTGAQHTLRKFVKALNSAFAGKKNTLCLYFDHDISIEINGTTPISGHYPNLEMINHILVPEVATRISELVVEVVEMIIDNNTVAASVVFRGKTASGELFCHPPGGCVLTLSNGKISHIMLFPDTTLIETQLYQRRFIPNQEH